MNVENRHIMAIFYGIVLSPELSADFVSASSLFITYPHGVDSLPSNRGDACH